MNISELVAILQDMQAKHGDMPVQCTWEGCVEEIGSIYVTRGNRPFGPANGEPPVLLIDADASWPGVNVAEVDVGYKIAGDS